jgi:outer membrane protein assembly factor BamA
VIASGPSAHPVHDGPVIARLCLICATIIAFAMSAGAAIAQETREQTIVAQQREKATQVKPYEPNKAERLLAQLQDTLVVAPKGFYPMFGSVYSGGGFTLGAGYRQYLGDRVNWNISGLYSAKNYKLIELALHSPRPLSGHVDFNVAAGWRDATAVNFHGLGIDSPEDQSLYRMQQGYVGGDISVRPRHWTILRTGLGYEAFTLSNGPHSHPAMNELFTSETAPGLGESPDYLHAFVSAAIDTRPAPDYARRGSLVEIVYHQYADRDDTYSFDRVDAEVIQHVPILRESWVLSFRGRLQATLDDNDVVPYFLMPSLGSGSTLRGYHSWRFRDRHSLLFTAEWRWMPSRLAMDAAIFYDAGTVADRLHSLSIADMKGDIGFGVRFHSPVLTPLRIEIAKGSEALKVVFAASAAF